MKLPQFSFFPGISLALVLADLGGQNMFAADGHWVGTWGCGPQLTEPGNLPPLPLAHSTLRQFVHVTLPGKKLRLRFSNAFGTDSVTLNSVHVALASSVRIADNGTIDLATDKGLSFREAPSAVIPAGETVWSDPFDYDLPALTNLAISIYFGDISATKITGHPGSRTTSFIAASNAVSAAKMRVAARTAHWYILTGVDVMADPSSAAIVVLGDSITDGRGSTTDSNNRWPDVLAQRLRTNRATANVGVLNMGVGGNGIFGGLGPSANSRFERDVLNQSGVKWLIVFEGVNDIGAGGASASSLIAAYQQYAAKAHGKNLRAYGATIAPFGGHSYYSDAHETARQVVNAWFRTNTVYDGLLDFDAAVRNPITLTNLLPAYDSGDHLHLNPVGYQAMASAVDLTLFVP